MTGKPADIAADLRCRIASGEFGSALPSERDLAKRYDVARNTLRKALAELEGEGALSRQVGRGTEIRAPVDPEWIAIVSQILGSSPLDIMNLRLMIEPPATAIAATHASVEALEAIRDAHDEASATGDMGTFERWDMEFHKRIFDATRNEFLANLHEILAIVRNRQPMVEIRRRRYTPERKRAYCEQHAVIVEALARRDADGAGEAMRAHLAARSRNLFGTAGDPR